jgi:hypothetical protein
MKNLKVGKSKIQGKGLFTTQPFTKGSFIGLAHEDDQPSTMIGKYHNHSETPNAMSVKVGGKRYLVAKRPLKNNEEITTDYRLQPKLEQPDQFKRGGIAKLPKMPKPSKKGVLAKGYSRSIEATNRFFTENKLFEKPKSRKRKVFDPNANYEDGGSLPQAEYGMPMGTGASQNYQGRRKFIHQDGGITSQEEIDAANNTMMKARLAYADMHGNPAAKRMITMSDNPYQFEDGDTGTHYMASMDEYAVPQIQDEDGTLMLGDYGPNSNEAIRFDNTDDANYFAENYKTVSPGFIETELTDDEIEEYRRGGWIVEDIY